MGNYSISAAALQNLKNNNVCTVIDISQRKIKPTVIPSNYTSHGKRKCRRADPIRTIEEIQAIKDYLLNNGKESLRNRNYLLFILGISVGLRGCDLLRLKIKDVVNVNGYVVDELSCYESKTHKMNHPILNDAAKEAIVQYLNTLPNPQADDYLFCADGRSTPMTPNNLYVLMNNIQKQLNLPYHLGAHSLRKTFAYWTIKLHSDDPNIIYSLQEMLNHDSPKTTLHYSGHTKESLCVMYKDMSDVVNGNITTEETTDKIENQLDQILALLTSGSDN